MSEWPTLLVLAACYTLWLLSLILHGSLGPVSIVVAIVVAIYCVTLFSSLQHEMLHGHPTRNPTFNELLVFPALNLFIPYRRFRHLHLRHHRDKLLTDPYEDPETWYLSSTQWQQSNRWMKRLLAINNTLAGRMIIGPALSLTAFYRQDYKLIRQGRRHIALAWFYHAVGVITVFFILHQVQIPIWYYVVAIAYPAMSLLMLRTFIEHRAAQHSDHQTAVVESGWLMSLLFLNNNLHAVHHRYPGESWFRLPERWNKERLSVLATNGHYYFSDGYLGICKRWLFRRKEPIAHPFHSRSK
ncbi:MAG: fatty acid desaturase [Granulosicoccus sp.]|nr:fatty acid desaturase [Granulosicoccus sp.]